MRPLECVLLAVLALAGVAATARRGGRGTALASAVALLAQVVVEEPRWQLVPAYAVAALAVVPALAPRWGRSSAFGAVLLVLAGAAAVPPLLFPVFRLPEPTGPHAIGTRYLHLEDALRDELFTPEPDARALAVQVWYPARQAADAETEPYCRHADVWSRAWSAGTELERFPFLWSHLDLVETHAVLDAPAEDGPFPALIFSHGYWQSWRLHTALMEELASHGYVVLSIARPFEAPYTLTADGGAETFRADHPRLVQVEDERDAASFAPIRRALADNRQAPELPELLVEFYESQPTWRHDQETWAKDILFVVDELVASRILPDLVDVERIGAFGFSNGGTASGLAALLDERIAAGASLDGWQTGHLVGDLACPFLFVTAEANRGVNDWFFERATGPAIDLVVRGARHANFHERALAAPWLGRRQRRLGDVDPERCLALVRSSVLAFFDEALKGTRSDLLQGDEPAPGVELRSRNR